MTEKDADAPAVLTERRGNVMVVTINRPEARNAINGAVSIALGDAMAQAQQDPDVWVVVITGAGGGIMEAGHRGAGREASMGLNIMLPFEQGANEYIVDDPKLVTMKYFFTRKLMFVKECSAVVCLPGGFGTLDEALETLTLMQTGKQTMLPLVLLVLVQVSALFDPE